MNKRFERMWKLMVLSQFEVLSVNSPGKPDEKHEKPQ
jgi:hypothetical protein